VKGGFVIGLLAAASLCISVFRLPAATCILVNTQTEKPCKMDCCANKNCCATSHERTGAPNQPLAKSTVDTSAIVAPVIALPVPSSFFITSDSQFVSRAEPTAHSPPRLPLLCTFLI
jgi:hypothetical protein